MKKSQSLRTKWTLLTTSITFIIFMLFSLFIIYFISIYLKEQEINNAKRSIFDVKNVTVEKTIGELTDYDIRASITDTQKFIMYSNGGQEIFSETSNPELNFTVPFEMPARLEVKEIKHEEKKYLIATAPINNINVHGYICIIHPLNVYYAIIQYMIILASIFGLTALFLTALISYLFSNQITKPIRKLSTKMKQIKRDGFQKKLSMSTSYHETDDMIETFNDMMYQLEKSFEQQKQFVEDASHELRTPLQIINGHLNLIQRWGKNNPDVMEESLSISLEEMNRINKLVEELLLLSKDSSLVNQSQMEIININEDIENRLKSLRQLNPEYLFEFHSTHPIIKLKINRYHFEQILLIFLDNAMKYDTVNKHITVRTSLKNRMIQIEIIDNGEGIPKENLPNIFDRFYRVDKSRSRSEGGNGLGLSIARKLIQTYHGKVKIESELNKYTKVMIQFNDSGT